jgi:hypothetical protein
MENIDYNRNSPRYDLGQLMRFTTNDGPKPLARAQLHSTNIPGKH